MKRGINVCFRQMGLVLGLAVSAAGCSWFGGEDAPSEPVQPPASKSTEPHKGALKDPVSAPKAATPQVDERCHQVKGYSEGQPLYLPEAHLVVTRFMKTCIRSPGVYGVTEEGSYLAMGFPCTGGSGRLETRGSSHAPKALIFNISNDCGMSPASQMEAHRAVKKVLNLPGSYVNLAYTPFVVQYWELPGLDASSVGFSVEVPTGSLGLIQRLRDGQPLTVKLYGRENAWVQGGYLYQVDGSLFVTGKNTFRLKVDQVTSLSPEKIQDVRTRCLASRGGGTCGLVFGSSPTSTP